MVKDRAPASDDPLDPPLGFLLVRIAEAVDRRFVALLEPLELRPRQLHILRYLAAHRPMSQQELAAGIAVDPANVIETLDDMQARGLISRAVDPADRRRRRLALTAKGRRRMEQGVEASEQAEREILGMLDATALASLRSHALRIYAGLQNRH
jgi:DNA-binding MarR family transcriptional regulator